MGKANVFVLGLDEQNLDTLREVPRLAEYLFHPLLSTDELQGDEIAADELLATARQRLADFGGPVDAIVGYWDFPVSTMLPVLCGEYGLPSASLRSVLTCEHKYWSRIEQAKVIDAHPAFGLVDLDDPAPPEHVGYPMWLKPVKSVSSELAFHVTDDGEFVRAVEEIAAGIDRLGAPFEFFLDQVDLPAEIAAAGGRSVLAEEAMSGTQAAVEGYSFDGDVRIYGALDCVNYPDVPSFLRFEYPSRLDPAVVEHMADVAKRVIGHVGLDGIAFSVEFFCDPDGGDVRLLEINPRHSQSHAELFEHVDGVPNHHAMLCLALGREPEMPYRRGEYRVAAKWLYRRRRDGIVRLVPTADDIRRVEQEIPGSRVHVIPTLGQRLSDLPGQDSYSYELAHVIIGADDPDDLRRKYDRAVAMLPFEFDAVGQD